MAMKKKFFGLALAGAMAFSSTGVYANTIQKGEDANNTITHTVPVTGVVRGDDGSAPAGRIEVVVPTAMEFTVDQDGQFRAASNYEVENKSKDINIKVQVASFVESDPTGGITVAETISKDTDKRSKVKLSLVGNKTSVNGITLTHNGIKTPTDLLTVDAGNISGIVLAGEAGGKDLEENSGAGITEKFDVTFKISKTTESQSQTQR